MVVRNVVHNEPRAYDIMMFDFADFAEKCLSRPWQCHVMSANTLGTLLSTYTHCILCGYVTAIYHSMDILTSNCVPLLNCAASNLTEDFERCIVGQILGGCIDSVMVDQLLTAFLLCAYNCCIRPST
jgi:hypothetical protein